MKTRTPFLKYCFFLFFVLGVFKMNSQVKIGNNPSIVDPSAVLELEKTNQGLLITRIALVSATDITTVPSPSNSLLIYNTATAGSAPDAIYPGFYYWNSDASRWMGLVASEEGAIYYDANDHMLYVRTDTGWQALW